MKYIYGVPVITTDDLFLTSLRSEEMSSFVYSHEEDIIRDLRGEITNLESLFKSEFIRLNVDFIPLDIMSRYILYKLVEDSNIASNAEVIESARADFNDFIENREFRFNPNILHVSLVRESIENHLIDVCINLPSTIISKAKVPVIYKCCGCEYTETTLNKLPNMFYTVADGEIKYFCKNCKSNHYKLVHVGDSFSCPCEGN